MPGFKPESIVNLTDSHSLSVESVFTLKVSGMLVNNHTEENDDLRGCVVGIALAEGLVSSWPEHLRTAEIASPATAGVCILVRP